MKRDDALVTAILSKIEARGRPWIGQDTVKGLAAPAPLEYHIQLCADAGFLVVNPAGVSGSPGRATTSWNGGRADLAYSQWNRGPSSPRPALASTEP